MQYFKNCSDLQEAKQLFRKLSKKFHPDMGGTAEQFRELYRQFSEFQASYADTGDSKEHWQAGKNSEGMNKAETLAFKLVDLGLQFDVIGSWVWLRPDQIGKQDKDLREKFKSMCYDHGYKPNWNRKRGIWQARPAGQKYKKKTGKMISRDKAKEVFGGTEFTDKDLRKT